jgi:hypothetical protein
MTTYTRRILLQRGGVAAFGLAGVGAGSRAVLSSIPALAASDPTRDNLIAAFGSPAGTDVHQQLASLLSDPAGLPALTSFVESQAQNLTGFQSAVLGAVPEIVQASAALQNVLTGTPLTTTQSSQLRQLKADLHSNPAIQLLNSTGAQFKGSSGLQSAVSEYVTNLSTPFTPLPPGGGPAIDTFDANYAALRSSASFGQYATTLTPLMQDPSFLEVLQGSNPLVVASYIPPNQAWKLLLPGDHDPSISDIVDFVGGIIVIGVGLAAAIAAALGASVALVIGLSVLAAILGIGVLTFHFLATIDCDHDGDPWDSNDVVGVEC